MTQNIDECIQALLKTCISLSEGASTTLKRKTENEHTECERIEILSQPREPPKKPDSPVFSFTPTINRAKIRRENTFESLYAEGVEQIRRRDFRAETPLERPHSNHKSVIRSFDFNRKLYQGRTSTPEPEMDKFTPHILTRSRELADSKKRRELISILLGSQTPPTSEPKCASAEEDTPKLTVEELNLFFERQRNATHRKKEWLKQQEHQLEQPHIPKISQISQILTESRKGRYADPLRPSTYHDPNETFKPEINEISRIIGTRKVPYYDYKSQIRLKNEKIEKLATQINSEKPEPARFRPSSNAESVLRDFNNIGEYYREKIRRRNEATRLELERQEEEELAECTFKPHIYPAPIESETAE